MKPCPFCGVMLTAALVDSIIDPKQPEFCPRNPPITEKQSRVSDPLAGESLSMRRLVAYAMLGSIATARVSATVPVSTQEGTK